MENMFNDGKEKLESFAASGTPEQQEVATSLLNELAYLQNPLTTSEEDFYASDKCATCGNYSGYGNPDCGQHE